MSFLSQVAAAIEGQLGIQGVAALLEVPPEQQLGDYALPCFTFAKTEKKAPQEIAASFAEQLAGVELFDRVTTVGPYVNIFLQRSAVVDEVVQHVMQEPMFGSRKKREERVMIEYSQPNTHKAFHVGHIRGTAIGEALARILRYDGYEVIQANYSGDTGMHVAKWLWCYQKFHAGEQLPAKEKGGWLASIYVDAVQRLEKEPELQEEVDAVNRALDEGKDADLMARWKETRQWSIDEFNEIYKELQAHFDVWFFEREVEQRGKEISQELVQRGVAEESDGAIIVNLEKEKQGVWVLLRKDSTPLYSAKDLALAERKFGEFKIGRSIYVIGNAQSLHMQQLFTTLKLMGVPQAAQCFHLSYDEVRFPEGKMSSRTGKNLLYSDIREMVFTHTEKEIRSRHADWSEEKVQRIVKSVGVCALKFEMIYRDTNKPIIYDVQKVCDFEGDTGPYIQYTHARCNSILAKLGKEPTLPLDATLLSSNQEHAVAMMLLNFPRVVAEIGETLQPKLLAQYVLALAKAFNAFYHECRVVGEQEALENARAVLVEATRRVLEQGLQLLGIDAPKQM